MKNWKKLLICILISMMVTSFIGLEVNRIYTSYVKDYIESNSEEFKEVGKFYGEQLKNAAATWQEQTDENFNKNEDEADTEYLGLVYEIYRYENLLNVYGLYYMLLVFGVVVGVMAYFIFVKQTKILKLFLPFIIGLGVLAGLYYLIMSSSEIGFSIDELLYCLAGYIVIVALSYIINICRPKENK